MLNSRQNQIILAAIVLGLAGLGIILYLNVRPEPPIDGVVQYPRPERGHDDTLLFPLDEFPLPPPGGQHFNIWQNCGVYNETIETGNAVHALEHGAVWITYNPDLPADQVAELEEVARAQTFLLLSPYPDQPTPIALTAWGLQLEVDSADDGRIEQFIERYRLGSQTPEPGAICTQGVGVPLP